MHKNTCNLSIRYPRKKILNWECKENYLNLYLVCQIQGKSDQKLPVFSTVAKIKTKQIRDNQVKKAN